MTVIVNKHGEIIQTIYAPDDVVVLNTPENCVALPDPSNLNMYLDKGEWVDIPPQPSNGMVFDYTIKQWIDPRTLDEIKAQKWAEIKAQRDQLEFGSFEFESNIYDSDQVSQSRIMGAAAAGIDQVWTLRDNTTVNLTASQLQQLYAALQAHIASVHERGRIARQLIFEAETKEQVEAVNL
ncbi:DUF4376 domain-containing protein [Acinetobacter lwoffii]|uniref:DUF4376 domain-containing protein n=1 Tax=Acinetobacter lwoffii TaxID=28090 RepID=UPI00300B2848